MIIAERRCREREAGSPFITRRLFLCREMKAHHEPGAFQLFPLPRTPLSDEAPPSAFFLADTCYVSPVTGLP